jgi:hypothetical protein
MVAKGTNRAVPALVAGLLLAASGVGLGQEPANSSPPAAQAAPGAAAHGRNEPSSQSPHAPDDAPPGPGLFATDKPGEASKASPSGWARVPDLWPIPRPGDFLLPPQGPGYYTALDWIRGDIKDKPPASPYPPLYWNAFFDCDFRYLDAPNAQPVDCFDYLKRMHFLCSDGCDPSGWMLSVGGEFRYRYNNEIGGAFGRLNGKDDRYDLFRTRLYTDLWYRDCFRIYVEYLDAHINGEDEKPLSTDVDKSDLLNAFVDIKLFELDDHPGYARVGRQELLYGSQRLISSPDFLNARRTFEGARILWHNDDWKIDGFWVRPVLNIPDRFDFADHNRQFAGLFTTYRPAQGQAIDLYWLYLESDIPVTKGFVPGGRAGYNLNTFGMRYSGDRKMSEILGNCGRCSDLCGSLLWDMEGGVQFGDYSNRDVIAGFSSTGLGYAFNGLPMQPQLWTYFDYASGTPNLTGTGAFETFNQLFPFGHYYLGFLDEVGRENIHDLNFQATVYPAKWITFLAQYHVFRLDQARDALYGVTPGYPINRFDPSGRAGTNVGDELDLLTTFLLDRHNTLQVGYSKLFSGDFIKQTGVNTSPEYFYVQYYLRF